MRSTGTVGLASWSSPTGISQMAYRLLHTGIAHHVLCRTYTKMVWTDEALLPYFKTCAGPQLLYAAIGQSMWPVNFSHRPNLWVRQATIQTVASTDETFSPCSSLYHTSHIYVLVSPPLFAGLFEKYFENTTPSCSLKLCDSCDVCNLLGLVICRSVHLWYNVCKHTDRHGSHSTPRLCGACSGSSQLVTTRLHSALSSFQNMCKVQYHFPATHFDED